MSYTPSDDRYSCGMQYRRAGRSGVSLPEITLGLWHNFGDISPFDRSRSMLLHAFDKGICHFDLANNYGPSYGSAEITFGKVMASDLAPFRHEMFISTKAGYDMFPGLYGDGGSRKYLMTSLDQSLKRMQLDYVDIFYSHRYDPATPLEETMQALVDIVRSGKALYAGISNYPAEVAAKAYKYLADRDVHCLLYQGKYSMLVRGVEGPILDGAAANGTGFVAGFPPGRAPRETSTCRLRPSLPRSWSARAGSRKSPHPADRASPRWPSPGTSGTLASPLSSSAPAQSHSSTPTWAHFSLRRSAPKSLRRSTVSCYSSLTTTLPIRTGRT